MTGAPVWASHTRASPQLLQATIRLPSGEKFRCVTRPSSGRRWRKAPVAVSRTSPAPRPVITNQRESGLNLASQVEKPFVQIRGSGDLIRTSQSRAVPSAEAVARRWPLPEKLRNQILPSCSPLRVSNSPVARFTQPRLPSRSPTNRRSPDGEKASAESPLLSRAETVSEGLEGCNKPPVSDLRFQTESSFTPADGAQRPSASRPDLGSWAIPNGLDVPGSSGRFTSQISFPLEADQAPNALSPA